MKRSLHLISLLILFGLPAFIHAQPAPKASKASLEVILVEASNDGSGIDPSLKPYAGNLKRLFRFDSYEQVQKSRTDLALPGSTQLSLKNKTSLHIQGTNGGSTIQADLNWKRGQSSLLRTKLRLKKGTPAVLGGPKSKKGNYLLIITPK